MKKKMLLALMVMICMMLLININTSAATTNTTIDYPEETLYNKNDPNLVPIADEMNLRGKTLYFNVEWNLANYVAEGNYVSSFVELDIPVGNGSTQLGSIYFSLSDDGEPAWSYLDIKFSGLTFACLSNELYDYGNSNCWLLSSFTFPDNDNYLVSTTEFELTAELSDGSTITIPLEDLVLVTKEKGQLIPTAANVTDTADEGLDLQTIIAYGWIICMIIFVLRSIKR